MNIKCIKYIFFLLLLTPPAGAVNPSQLDSPDACRRLLKNDREWRAYNREVWGTLDFQNGNDLVKEVREWNKKLQSRHWTLAQLKKAGLIEIDTETKIKTDSGVLPYYIMRFPKIFTGMYFPKSQLSPRQALESPSDGFRPDLHQAINIVIPGIGTTASVALGMAPLGGTFTNEGGFKPYLGDVETGREGNNVFYERGYRAYSVLMDTSFNGLGEEMPAAFATQEARILAIRHVQLLLTQIYNVNKYYIFGRSDGGALALAYATRFGPGQGLYGVVGCNPSLPLEESVKYGQFVELATSTLGLFDGNVQPHTRSWIVHNAQTPKFKLDVTSKAPSLILHSFDDTISYPQDIYTKWLNTWIAADPKNHKVEHFSGLNPADAHNLWNNKITATYQEVIGIMYNFILDTLP